MTYGQILYRKKYNWIILKNSNVMKYGIPYMQALWPIVD